MPQANHFIPDNQVFRYDATVSATAALSTSTTLPTFVSLNFQFTDLDDSANLGTVFDQYRIDVIEFWIIPESLDFTSNTTSHGLLCTVIDYDDSSALSSFAAANDYSNCITSSGICGHYRVFRPHSAVAAYAGAFTSYGNVSAQWFDIASPAVQHYGLKIAVATTDAIYKYDTVTKYHCSLRNVR